MSTIEVEVKFQDLEMGSEYVVLFEDCCIRGRFYDTIYTITEDEIMFDNGIILTEWGQVTFWEVKDPNAVA